MTIRLPKPLPYDYVDRLIDETYRFWTDECRDTIIFRAEFANGDDPSNYARPMISIIDIPESRVEDEEGYINDPYIYDAYEWTATPLTEEQIDYILY